MPGLKASLFAEAKEHGIQIPSGSNCVDMRARIDANLAAAEKERTFLAATADIRARAQARLNQIAEISQTAEDAAFCEMMARDPEAFRVLVRRRARPDEGVARLARFFKVSRQAVYRALERAAALGFPESEGK